MFGVCAEAPGEEGCYECLGCLGCYVVVEVLGKGGQHNGKKEGGERTSQRDRTSSLLIVSAYFMMSRCPEEVGEKCVPDE